MILLIILLIVFVVLVIAVTTALINHKPKCDHDWEDLNNGVSKCSKCSKTIYPYTDNKEETEFA